MKILQINTVCGIGSTGAIVMDLATEIEKRNNDCFIVYGQGVSDYQKSYKIGGILENHLHNLGSRLFGNQGYYSKNGTLSLIKYIEKIKPHVIHLHNLHGNYLNIKLLFNFLSEANIPVVWTLHDCWPFTGKCSHYTSVNCHKWVTGCYKCPLVHAYPPSLILDRSKEIYSDKKQSFNSVKSMTIVSVSKWLEKEISHSFLKSVPIKQIYNWVDTKKFYPQKMDSREKYGIAYDKHLFLTVGAAWSKNSTKFQDAIRFADGLNEDSQLVVIGKLARGTIFPSNIFHIPYIHDETELAKLYSMATGYIHFSIEDTFGKVIAEAMACGTPVVVYNSTACPELVGEDCGFVVNPHDISAMLIAISKLKEGIRKVISYKCVQHVKQYFDYETNINKYLGLYESILNK